MVLHFRDILHASCSVNGTTVPYEEKLQISVAGDPVVVELRHAEHLQNNEKSELRSNLLTRVQGENIWKALNFNNTKMPRFVQEALKELDALHYE